MLDAARVGVIRAAADVDDAGQRPLRGVH
jgi:hypothetical protein